MQRLKIAMATNRGYKPRGNYAENSNGEQDLPLDEKSFSYKNSSRGRGGSKSSKRVYKPGNKPKTQSLDPPAPIPTPEPNLDIGPKKQSSKSSTPKNDPMCQDFDMEGFDGLTAYYPRCKFTTTFEGYIGLINKTYDVLAVEDKNFKIHISKSIYAMYCWHHLYARIVGLKQSQGTAQHVEDNFYNFVASDTNKLPLVLEEYLKSIGTFVDRRGVHFEFVPHVWPNANGHFGRVSADTHWMYESLAAPSVLKERICKDYAYTTRQNEQANWDLPAALRPAPVNDNEPGLPTVNLLGWDKASKLTSEQLSVYEAAGITDQDFPSEFSYFKLNKSIFNQVSERMRKLEERVKFDTTQVETPIGSIGQALWSVRDAREVIEFDRQTQYSEGPIRQNSPYQEDKRITLGALMCSFRVKKVAVNNLRCYSCYDWTDYTHVPDDWELSCNSVFAFGEVQTWNLDTFRTPFTLKDPSRTSWIRKIIKPKS